MMPNADNLSDPNINNLVVNTAVYSPKGGAALQVSPCTLENVPIQKWTNVIITINNIIFIKIINYFC